MENAQDDNADAVRSSEWLGAWVECKERLPQSGRVLVFSPLYKVGDSTRFRVMDAQFVRISTEVTHWMDLDAIAPNMNSAKETPHEQPPNLN